jgi:hypothetical protein
MQSTRTRTLLALGRALLMALSSLRIFFTRTWSNGAGLPAVMSPSISSRQAGRELSLQRPKKNAADAARISCAVLTLQRDSAGVTHCPIYFPETWSDCLCPPCLRQVVAEKAIELPA